MSLFSTKLKLAADAAITLTGGADTITAGAKLDIGFSPSMAILYQKAEDGLGLTEMIYTAKQKAFAFGTDLTKFNQADGTIVAGDMPASPQGKAMCMKANEIILMRNEIMDQFKVRIKEVFKQGSTLKEAASVAKAEAEAMTKARLALISRKYPDRLDETLAKSVKASVKSIDVPKFDI